MSNQDELYQDARALVIENQTASVSMLQRKFRIGYTRAAKLIDALEEAGVVGPYDGAKPREVLINDDLGVIVKKKNGDELIVSKDGIEVKENKKKGDTMGKLNPKQELFVKEYLVDLNATQAAIRAGYSEKSAKVTGCRLLTNDNIQARVQEKQHERAEKLELDADWVLQRLKAISDRSMQAEPVMEFDHFSKELVHTGEYQFDSSGANRATELIGKHLGMFKDRIDINANMAVMIVDDVEDDDDE